MFGNLYIQPAIDTNLREFGKILCKEFGIVCFDERESSNYSDGHYLTAQCLGMVIRLALTDDDDLADYPFWLNLKADGFWIEESVVFEGVSDLLARKLTLAGNKVVRCPDDGRVGADIWIYSIKAGSRGTARGEIEIVKQQTPNSSPL
jgi:hypothetical protein